MLASSRAASPKTQSGKQIFAFDGWGSAVVCMQQSPALDVVACGLADGRIVLHNLKTDKTVMVLRHADASVTSLSFRSDHASAPAPMLVSGDSNGALAVWDLNKRRMLSLMKNAHRHGGMRCAGVCFAWPRNSRAYEGVASVAFLSGEPVMLSAGSLDNAIRMWIFDSGDHTGKARLLRERTGEHDRNGSALCGVFSHRACSV